ncbi:MAG: hypothetical protein RL262_1047, partial [Bacteroidota bacterium]
MNIKKLSQWGEWCIWFLNPLLLLLAIYSETSKTNDVLLWFGKLHPLVLHFPIVIGIAIVIYFLFFQNKALEENTEKFILVGNALMASMVALLGLFTVSSSAVLSANSSVESALNGKFIANVASAGVQSGSMSVLNAAYAANAKIGKIHVKVDNAGVPADGRSELNVHVTVYDLQGSLMK